VAVAEDGERRAHESALRGRRHSGQKLPGRANERPIAEGRPPIALDAFKNPPFSPRYRRSEMRRPIGGRQARAAEQLVDDVPGRPTGLESLQPAECARAGAGLAAEASQLEPIQRGRSARMVFAERRLTKAPDNTRAPMHGPRGIGTGSGVGYGAASADPGHGEAIRARIIADRGLEPKQRNERLKAAVDRANERSRS
jgi:hypothetical protein